MPKPATPREVQRHLRPDENLEWWGKPSPRGIVPVLATALVGVVIGIPSLILWATGTSQAASGLAFLGAGIAASALGRAADRGQAVLFTTYVLTDQRVISVRSLISTTTNSVTLDRVSAIQRSHGVIGRILGFQELKVSAYGASGTRIRVPALLDPDPVSERLAKLTVDTATPRWLLRGD